MNCVSQLTGTVVYVRALASRFCELMTPSTLILLQNQGMGVAMPTNLRSSMEQSRNAPSLTYCVLLPGVSVSLMGVCHNSLGLTMLFLVLSALFLEVRSPASVRV